MRNDLKYDIIPVPAENGRNEAVIASQGGVVRRNMEGGVVTSARITSLIDKSQVPGLITGEKHLAGFIQTPCAPLPFVFRASKPLSFCNNRYDKPGFDLTDQGSDYRYYWFIIAIITERKGFGSPENERISKMLARSAHQKKDTYGSKTGITMATCRYSRNQDGGVADPGINSPQKMAGKD